MKVETFEVRDTVWLVPLLRTRLYEWLKGKDIQIVSTCLSVTPIPNDCGWLAVMVVFYEDKVKTA